MIFEKNIYKIIHYNNILKKYIMQFSILCFQKYKKQKQCIISYMNKIIFFTFQIFFIVHYK